MFLAAFELFLRKLVQLMLRRRHYYVVEGDSVFAKRFVEVLQTAVLNKGNEIKILLAKENRKINGCRVFEIPIAEMVYTIDEVDRIGDLCLKSLQDMHWFDRLSAQIVKDCRKLKTRKVRVNFMLVNRCKYSKKPGFIFYWQARSK